MTPQCIRIGKLLYDIHLKFMLSECVHAMDMKESSLLLSFCASAVHVQRHDTVGDMQRRSVINKGDLNQTERWHWLPSSMKKIRLK